MLMLVMCAGAGPRSSEFLELAASHISTTGDGYMVAVPSGIPRRVPLLADWDDWMTAVLEQAPDEGPLWGPPNRMRHDALLSSFTQYTVGVPPQGARLRATWLAVHLAAGVPMKELLRAAGLAKFEHLGLLLAYVPDATADEYVRVLRGRTTP